MSLRAAAAAAATEVASRPAPPPGIWRRLAAFVYEGVLLFGVTMLTALAYGLLVGQRHALTGSLGLQVVLFLVYGLYFVHFWSRHGQTLAMRTWHLRVQHPPGGAPAVGRAVARYLLAWAWFLPALVYLHLSGLRSGWQVALALVAGVLGYAALARLRPDRQFWHDVLCGTVLVTDRPSRG